MKKNHLPDSFWSMPECAYITLEGQSLKETLLATDGTILACGRIYDIVSKSLGAGVFRVSLKRRK